MRKFIPKPEVTHMIFIKPIMPKIAKFTVSLYNITVTKNVSTNEDNFIDAVIIF